MLTSLIKMPFAILRDTVTVTEDIVVGTVDVLKSIPTAVQEGLNEGMFVKPNTNEELVAKISEVLPDSSVVQAVEDAGPAKDTTASRRAELMAELEELDAMDAKPLPFKTLKA